MLTKGQHFSCQNAQHHVLHCTWTNLLLHSQKSVHVRTTPEKWCDPVPVFPCEWTTHAEIMKEVLLVLPQGMGKILSKFSEAMRRCLKVTTAILCNVSSHRFMNRQTLWQKPLPQSLGKMKTKTKGLSETLQPTLKTTAKGNKCRKQCYKQNH